MTQIERQKQTERQTMRQTERYRQTGRSGSAKEIDANSFRIGLTQFIENKMQACKQQIFCKEITHKGCLSNDAG